MEDQIRFADTKAAFVFASKPSQPCVCVVLIYDRHVPVQRESPEGLHLPRLHRFAVRYGNDPGSTSRS